MARKKVAVVLRRPPMGTAKDSEGLRMSVGLTLSENEVTVVLVDSAAWVAVAMSPQAVQGGEFQKPLDTLRMLKMRVWVEEESLERFGVTREELLPGLEVVCRKEIESELAASEAVICF